MCGIAGYWNFKAADSTNAMRDRIERMTNTLRHRGPDSGGLLLDPAAGLALGHRRLAVRDLARNADQPMSTPDGRYTLCYNGEIYHVAPLREKLRAKGAVFRTASSDTEVLLYACALLGLEYALAETTGMFAFALFDHRQRRLFLVRDRFGVKPLYYGRFGQLLVFGSELKALTAHGGWEPRIENRSVADLIRTGFINAPLSIYQGVHKLQPGHMLEVDADGNSIERCWWNPLATVRDSLARPLPEDESALLDELDDLLSEAVRARMVSDVPLGTFLSGGVDSSLVTALMQKYSSTPVRTFSIGFNEQEYNEAPFAKAVAEHLGTCHTEEYMRPSQAWEIIPSMPDLYDEPFADSSQLPTYLLSRLARKHVTVAMTGDGGDEMFSGYWRYLDFQRAYTEMRHRRSSAVNWAIRFLGTHFSPRTLDGMAALLPSRIRPCNLGLRLRHKATALAMPSWEFYRRNYLTYWPELPMLSPVEPPCPTDALDMSGLDLVAQARLADVYQYLPGDILTKVDRASMAVSLETRIPLLDHRVFAFAWRLPPSMHVAGGNGKHLLRRLLYRYVPAPLIDRPKMGFGVPIDHWLRGPLRDWAETLIAPERLRREGLLNADAVMSIWSRLLKGEDWQYWLWPVLMFQAWLEKTAGQDLSEQEERLVTRIVDIAAPASAPQATAAATGGA